MLSVRLVLETLFLGNQRTFPAPQCDKLLKFSAFETAFYFLAFSKNARLFKSVSHTDHQSS
jgi:hypothetical protein